MNTPPTPEDFVERYSYTALRFFLQALARELLPNDRINICWRHPLPQRKDVEIIYSEERQRARVHGTMKCGQGWYCPLCSSYISERRRDELGRALFNCRDRYVAVMVTYTIRHSKQMRLANLLRLMQEAYRKMQTGRAWMEVKNEFAMVGTIRAIEITYGESGWHPHYHVLLLTWLDMLRRDYEGNLPEYADALEGVLSPLWIDALDYYGLTATKERGLKVSCTDDDVKDYIAKYGKMPSESNFSGQTDEMTRSTQKHARNGNLSVWEILWRSQSSPLYKNLFVEYVEATRKRHPLQWSRNLKNWLDIDEIRDEIAAEGIETDTDRLLARVSVDLWKYIAHFGYMGQVMTYAHEGNEEKLGRLLDKLEAFRAALPDPRIQFDLGL